MKKTYFDGSVWSYISLNIVNFLIVLVTFGFGTPWAAVRTYKWESEHAVIDGKRFKFTGTATDLFGHWILWWILTVITFGIYGIVVRVRMIEWRVENTQLEDDYYSSRMGGSIYE